MTRITDAGAGSARSILDRAVRPAGQLWQVPTFIIGLLALVLVGAAGPLLPKPMDNKLESDLDTIRAALEKPGVPADDIVTLAETCVSHLGQQPDLIAGTAHYLLGTVYLRLAQATPAEHAHEHLGKAAMNLDLAELRGVPDEDRARLTYLRGKTLFLCNGDLMRVVELLSKSLPSGADNPAEGYGILVQAHLRKAAPDFDAALVANLKQIEFCDDEAGLVQARVQRGEMLLKLDRRVEAIKVLEQAAPKAAAKLRLKIRGMQARAAMDEGLWGRAIPWLQELLADPTALPNHPGRAWYNLGLCNVNFEPPTHEKQAVAAWNEALLYGGDEAQAAAMQLGELRLYSGNSKSALEMFNKALEKVCTPADYKNTLVESRKARELLEESCHIFNEQQDVESFELAAQLYKKLAPPGAADEKVAQAREARGHKLLDDASKGGPEEGVLREQARTWMQKAAQSWELATESRTPADRIDSLWHCVECYRQAEEPVRAIDMLKKFVELPASAERKAEAWFTVAEIQRALHQPAEAQDSYKQCVAFDNPAFKDRALLNLADMALERHELKEAEESLLEVAFPPFGVGDAISHELALLKLANLYFQQHQFEKATIQCKELIKQNPFHTNILSVREQLGECYRNLARRSQESADSPECVTAEKKQYYRREWQKNLELAKDVYQLLADDLDARAQAKSLSPIEETLRRKAHFVVADCYYDLPNWFNQAFKLYVDLFENSRLQPDGLWACQRLYRCLLYATLAKLPNVEVVREAAETAVEVCLNNLKTLDSAGAFTSEADRTQWQEWLERVQTDLRTAKRRGG
jgi:tetratricopeptide (TPR) repeat protein